MWKRVENLQIMTEIDVENVFVSVWNETGICGTEQVLRAVLHVFLARQREADWKKLWKNTPVWAANAVTKLAPFQLCPLVVFSIDLHKTSGGWKIFLSQVVFCNWYRIFISVGFKPASVFVCFLFDFVLNYHSSVVLFSLGLNCLQLFSYPCSDWLDTSTDIAVVWAVSMCIREFSRFSRKVRQPRNKLDLSLRITLCEVHFCATLSY